MLSDCSQPGMSRPALLSGYIAMTGGVGGFSLGTFFAMGGKIVLSGWRVE